MSRAPARLVFLLVVLPLALGGCNYGYRQLRGGHLAYNTALKNVSDAELLLNIVRLRYLDSIEFMTISSISSQLSFTVSLSGSFGQAGITRPTDNTYLFSPGVEYSTRPTFTFTPQQGAEFARSLLEPIPIEDLTRLMAADWDPHLLMRIFVRGMNRLNNELGLPDPEYDDTARKIGELWLSGDVEFGFIDQTATLSDPIAASQVSGSDLVEAARSGYQFRRAQGTDRLVLTEAQPRPVVAIRSEAPGAVNITSSLELKPGLPYYALLFGTRAEPDTDDRGSIVFRTRSLMNVLTYLSQGIEVPEAHLRRGYTTRDWPPDAPLGRHIEDIFRVRASKKRPAATLSVQYKGYWFYVDERDVMSRLTFITAAELFQLTLIKASGQGEGPLLTLPVGG